MRKLQEVLLTTFKTRENGNCSCNLPVERKISYPQTKEKLGKGLSFGKPKSASLSL
jgi:hypothetical protein